MNCLQAGRDHPAYAYGENEFCAEYETGSGELGKVEESARGSQDVVSEIRTVLDKFKPPRNGDQLETEKETLTDAALGL